MVDYTENDIKKCVDRDIIVNICKHTKNPGKCQEKHNTDMLKHVEAGFKKCITDKMKPSGFKLLPNNRIEYKGESYLPVTECAGMQKRTPEEEVQHLKSVEEGRSHLPGSKNKQGTIETSAETLQNKWNF